MTNEALKTLFHPFQAGLIDPPATGERVLFLGAEPGFLLPEGWGGALHAVQGFRPDFLAMQRAGLEVALRAGGDGYDVALVLAGRHRGQNELRVAEAIERTKPGGLIVVAGGKEDGIASLRKRSGGLVDIEGSEPKFHGIAFWFRKPDSNKAWQALYDANPMTSVEGRFRTAPGMFSFDRVDAGSNLLAGHLPADLRGHVADFCAGWGYLAAQMLDRNPDIAALDLYEADFEALEAAKANLAGYVAPKEFFWRDLVAESVERRYDAIAMNPPFHQGRAADPGIGQAIIRAAAKALKPGGRLFMVANRQLPYEAVLSAAFADVREVARDSGFKVLFARR